MQNRLGSLFFGCMVTSLLPFASMSLFVYDRQFYSKVRVRLLGMGSGVPYQAGDVK